MAAIDNDTPIEAQEVPDRREAIEAAFAQAEAEHEEAPVSETPPADSSAEPVSKAVPAGDAGATKEPIKEVTDAPKPEPEFSVDKAPQSWRAPQKAKWANLDPDVRQEIVRRERETTRVLGETANARSIAAQFADVVTPFRARLQSLGAQPFEAVQQLLQSDHILATAPKVQRAAFMAKLIKDYDIDILELDNALAGKEPVDPASDQLQKLLQQQLAPLQNYIAQQQQREQQREQRSSQQVAQTVAQMAANPEYPHFEDLREDMADIIDLANKRGVVLTLEQAYSRAVAMNPEVSAVVANQKSVEAKAAAAKASNARAQRALAASVSVNGSPSYTPTGAPAGGDRRAAIAAAFDQLEGR